MSELHKNLDATRDEALAMMLADPEGGRESFRVADLGSACWAVRKYAEATARIEARNAEAEEEIARIREYQEKINTEDRNTIMFMEELLRAYAAGELAKVEKSKKKSLPLPGATLQFRSQPPQITRNAEQLIDWAKRSGLEEPFVKTKEELDWSALKAACIFDMNRAYFAGEELPGVIVISKPDSFKVELRKENIL